MVSVSQRVVRRAARHNADQLHCGGKRLLRRTAAGLRVKNHLRVVPLRDPVRLVIVQKNIILQNTDIVKAPCQNGALAADPCAKPLQRLRKRQSLLKEGRVAQPR